MTELLITSLIKHPENRWCWTESSPCSYAYPWGENRNFDPRIIFSQVADIFPRNLNESRDK